ncbi:hypothetical protein ACTL32_18370 [Planococcus sp. FY231025]|uniref:hypothetical protein n=1 Tax=Planococcus sp. FY231025 TaxID=3455699 RepID=UPI003F93635F
MENFYDVRSIGVKYICDSCKQGEMVITGKSDWIADPPKFEHTCDNCKEINFFIEKYPTIRFVKKINIDKFNQ